MSRVSRKTITHVSVAACVGSLAAVLACGSSTQSFTDDAAAADGQAVSQPSSSGGSSSGGRSSSGPGSSSGSSGGGAASSSGSSGGASGASSGARDSGAGSSGGPRDASGGSSSSGGQGSGSSSSGSSSSSGGATCTPPTTGTPGFTTRFWDCCKPSCAWPGNVSSGNPAVSCNQQNQTVGSSTQSACNSGSAYACYSFAPWAVSSTMAYGFAAFNGGSCGQCYELRFTGQSHNGNADPGSASVCGKTMIVQVVNIGNIQQGQFDLMVPGGGVGQNTGACPTEWGVPASMLGDVNGGLLLTCQRQNSSYQAQLTCTKNACASVFTASNVSPLLAGCNWIADWLGGASNPSVLYQSVTCPSAITSVSGLQ